ncbi:MAG: hypothetical protein WDM80_07515 [Limisphaerales bacterium]
MTKMLAHELLRRGVDSNASLKHENRATLNTTWEEFQILLGMVANGNRKNLGIHL